MARQIIAEEPKQEEQDEQQVASSGSSVSDSVTTTANTSGIDGESTIITAREMKKLFHEWDANGQNDLCINSTLVERIQKYLEYQEQLDPLKAKLAKRIYKPYIINDINATRTFDIYVNDTLVLSDDLHCIGKIGNKFRVINLHALKCILSFIENPYAPYIDVSQNAYIDLIAYVASNGGSHNYDSEIDSNGNKTYKLHITL